MKTLVRITLCLLAVLVHLINTCSGFSVGPPISTCLTMFPKHGIDRTWTQSGRCPFHIKLSSDTYVPLQNITVTIEADDGRYLKGVQISAHRKSVNTEEFLGTFLSFLPDDKLQAFSCFGGRHNQVSHKNNNTVEKLTLTWQAPGENVGDVIFRATFVHNYSTFWALEKKELKTADPSSVILPPVVYEAATGGMDDIDFSGCGSDRGCFLYPRYCTGSDCDVALTYRKDGDVYMFEMTARTPGYVTMAISNDTVMGNDNTVTCTAFKDTFTVQNGINPAYYNHRVQTRNLKNLRVKQTASHVACTFSRPRVVGVQRWVPMSDPPEVFTVNFDLEESWYLMMSWGHVPYGTDVMGKHTAMPIVSDTLIDFRSTHVHSGSSMPVEIRAHGSLMVVSWVLLAGLAVVVARHYKDICGSRAVCGTKAWFQVHRGVAVLCLSLVAISFVIIFVKLKELSEGAGHTHAVIGITVGVAVLVQVFAGIIRPSPDSDIRPWFRWGHRLLGQLVHILAGVNMYMAFNMTYTPKSMSRFGSVAVIVWAVFQILWEIGLDIWAWRKKSAYGKGPISSSKGMQMEEGSTTPSTRVDMILLALYLLTLVTFTLTILCGVNIF